MRLKINKLILNNKWRLNLLFVMIGASMYFGTGETSEVLLSFVMPLSFKRINFNNFNFKSKLYLRKFLISSLIFFIEFLRINFMELQFKLECFR